MKEKDIVTTASILEEELRKSIIQKLDKIRESIILKKGSDKSSYYQMLMMIDDDVEDVLLNWEYDSISPLFSGRDDEDDDDEY